jgi:ABC-type lipoprotein release transport system permease subunit
VGERAAGTLQEFLPDASIDLPTPPDDTDGLVGIDQVPLLLGIALGVATMVTLTHTLLVALHARRRDLATLRACGYTVRQVWATVLAHSTIVTAAGLVIGLPLGLVAGRWLWSTWADSIGVVDTAVSPLRVLAVITVAALVGALLIAIGPARHASRARVAEALRAE